MKLLNQSQAEAVYSAMCALNNVGGLVDARMENRRVIERSIGIWVYELLEGEWEPGERYASQAEFAAAYGLDGERVEHLGLSFKVLAKFPEADSAAANAFMAANPNAGLLCIEGGIAYLVDMSDEGVAA